MGLNWKRKALMIKLETTYGVDSVPTAAADGILATNVSLEPMLGQDVSRELERPFTGGQPTVPVDLHSKLSFRVELAGAGAAATPPKFAPLLRAMGQAQVIATGPTPPASVTYNSVSENYASVSIYINIGGIRYVLLGARGTCALVGGASQIPYLEFEFWGFFTVPTDQAVIPTPVVTAHQTPLPMTRANTPTFTVNGVALILRSFRFSIGNTVSPRFLIGPQTAPLLAEEMLIEDTQEKLDITIEQVPLATFNPFTLAQNMTQVPLVLSHGTQAGNRWTLNIPRLQLMRPGALENRQGIVEQPLSGTPIPLNGNDQYTLVFN